MFYFYGEHYIGYRILLCCGYGFYLNGYADLIADTEFFFAGEVVANTDSFMVIGFSLQWRSSGV